ncbi:hypothetical protein OG462_44690 [Streptomyces sp. NBC_01077]|uniref:terpene synthase family protein n=1 Tax=Streptomyces sp. NBC_01077 TaxID=2903746 RepID=UPI00386C3BAD|nr:hypothetical protein OG462_00315 [Streptomyces sp. NBC_01077]WSV43784.1 hypothetical protein OG462_44690 [Streptomyces sp. NBC_01077]
MDVDLPAIYCPYPVREHAAIERITEESFDWADRFGIYPSDQYRKIARHAQFPWWHGLITPTADENRILPFAKFLSLQTVVAEFMPQELARQPGAVADLIARVECTLEVHNAKVLADYPNIMGALEDLVPQLRQLANPVQYERWLESARQDLQSIIRETWVNSRGINLSVNEYIPLRVRTMQITPYFFSNDIVCERAVPDLLYSRLDVRALHCLVLAHIGIRNDVRGYRKDASEEQCNFIPSLIRDTRCSEGEAIAQSVRMLDSIMYRCLEIRARAEKGEIPDTLLEHIDNTLSVISATLAYEQHARHSWYKYAGDMAQEFSDSPSSVAPLSYPAIAWCWEM